MSCRLTLTKRDSISLFGNDISPVVMDVEFHTEDRLRFKVSIANGVDFSWRQSLLMEGFKYHNIISDTEIIWLNNNVIKYLIISCSGSIYNFTFHLLVTLKLDHLKKLIHSLFFLTRLRFMILIIIDLKFHLILNLPQICLLTPTMMLNL